MLNIDEINEEITKLEKCDCTSYEVCRRLAILYTVRDHFKSSVNHNTVAAPVAPMAKAPTPQVGM